MLNADQVGGIIRALIPGSVVILTHYGFGTADRDTIILTALATFVVSAWSAFTNQSGTVIPPKGN